MRKGFFRLSKMYYANTVLKSAPFVDEITIGLYSGSGGTSGEFSIRWYNLDGLNLYSPKLEAFSDSWMVLNECLDFVSLLYNYKWMSPDECVELLLELGYEDFSYS